MSSVKLVDRGKKKSSAESLVVTKDVVTLAESRLRQDGHLSRQSISCSYHEGVLLLRGCVPTYYLKQIVQTVVMGIDGVMQVDNQIAVTASSVTREATGHDLSNELIGGRGPCRPR